MRLANVLGGAGNLFLVGAFTDYGDFFEKVVCNRDLPIQGDCAEGQSYCWFLIVCLTGKVIEKLN